MTPRDLLAAFDTLAEAPDGVTRLRELVLQLAVRGKLVPQDPEDEPASVLLERIDVEAATAARSRVRVEHEESTPFDIPSSWEWVYLGAAMNLVNGMAFKPVDWSTQGLPIVRIQNLNNPKAPFNYCDFPVKEKYHIHKGDLLLSWSGTPGTSFGAFVWAGGMAVLNQHIFRCEPRAEAYHVPFLRLAINSRLTEMIDRAHGAVGLRHITRGKLEGLFLVLPPLAEQKRIVARVDELMGLLDRLEAAQRAREATRAASRDAALAALREADTAEEVEVAWERLAEQLHDLFTAPSDVAPLRQTILQLAVRGRLVPQDPDDEPAELVLRRCKTAPISPSAEPFALPPGWCWTCLGRLGEVRGGGTPSKSNSRLWGGDLPWVSPKDMKRDRIGESQDQITRTALNESAVKLIPRDALLMVVRGMILAHSFPTALTTNEVTVNQDMKALLPADARLCTFLLLASKGYRDTVLSLVERSTHGTCKLATDRLLEMPIGLPPLAEQHRIVAKVDALMAVLDRLDERLTRQREAHEAFAAAAVHHLET